ncbi:MAG: argininosuccinate lyase [Deltaproteobacteria bacterium]|nr:argininosuccinate lyase [Deltaproteobacteria bacterium]MBW2086057.1 argininosuccinate lyase [Deltaproteobacteria bacterium]
MKTGAKPWGGRFTRATDDLLESFSASVHFDYKLYPYDIAGSIAHARMLEKVDLLTQTEAELIIKGLEEIKAEIEAGKFTWDPKLEDVHMNIEQALVDKIGAKGEKLHTARSRNDQVALDTRLYLKDTLRIIGDGIKDLRVALVRQGQACQDLVMPGYTHLQRAQPILLAHHLLAYNEMLKRDMTRFKDLYPRVDIMPLGSAALAGTGLPIDMAFVARELNFAQVVTNSLDGVSDRDYIIEFLAVAAILMMHLSRLSEDLILWATSEFGFIDLPDDLCTGSSIMPQKKNPDVPELIRAKTGRVYGNLMGLLTVMKGLPLSYNRDLQEDKEPLFDTTETLTQILPLMARLVSRLVFKAEKMRSAAEDPFITATDLADYLVKQGIPFRQAHEQVGKLVRYCLENNLSLVDLDESELIKLCPGAGSGVKKELTLEASLNARVSPGGTAPEQVKAALKQALEELGS